MPNLPVCTSNEKGAAPYSEKSVYRSLQPGQILGKHIAGDESHSQWTGIEQIWFFGKQAGRQGSGAQSSEAKASRMFMADTL